MTILSDSLKWGRKDVKLLETEDVQDTAGRGIPLTIKRAAAFFLALAVLFLLPACGGHRAKNADQTIHYSLGTEPATLDPQIASDVSSLTAIRALYEGLARVDAKGNAVPGAAESWEHNADSTEFTFHLRAGAKWAKPAGTKADYGAVTAQDFVFAFRRALDPKTGSSTCAQMYSIRNARKIRAGQLPADRLGVSAKDSRTLVVDLDDSSPDFPKQTAAAVFMPCNEKFFRQTAGRYGLESKYLLGNGPFRIDGAYGWTHGQSLNLVRSDTYAGNSKPLPAALDFSIVGETETPSDPISALKNQSVDATPISPSQIDSAKAIGCTLSSFEDTTWGLCFNTQSRIFKNVNIRRAFVQAFRRSAVLVHLPKGSSAAENILLPGTTLAGQNYRSLAGGPFYLKQSAGAGESLAAGLRELGLEKMESVTVLCPGDANVRLMVTEMIASWNRQFNNYFNMEPMDSGDLQKSVQAGSYDIAVFSVKPSGDGPLAVLSQFTSGAGGNPARLKDPAYDALVASAQTKSGREAAAAYAAAEKRLNEQAVFYPLYYEKSYYALAKGVSGILFLPYQGGADFINAGKE